MTMGRTLSGAAVVMATVGCAPPSHKLPAELTEPLRQVVYVGPPVNAEVSYLRAGDATGTRVILVHGTPGSAEAWTDYLLRPPAGVDLIALDRPGFGRSGPQDAVTSLRRRRRRWLPCCQPMAAGPCCWVIHWGEQ